MSLINTRVCAYVFASHIHKRRSSYKFWMSCFLCGFAKLTFLLRDKFQSCMAMQKKNRKTKNKDRSETETRNTHNTRKKGKKTVTNSSLIDELWRMHKSMFLSILVFEQQQWKREKIQWNREKYRKKLEQIINTYIGGETCIYIYIYTLLLFSIIYLYMDRY